MILNNQWQQQLDELRSRFNSAEPFRHLVIDNFFDTQFCQDLVASFPEFDDEFARNEMGVVGRKAVRTDVRSLGVPFCSLDDYIQTDEFLDTIGQMTGIDKLRYDPAYVGGGTHDNRSGQGLYPHVDFNYHPLDGRHRRLNLIIYLNEDWQEDWGGNLELHSNPWDLNNNRISSVLPEMNRAILFETNEHSWHGFQPIRSPDPASPLARRSFAIYLYTDDRPEDDTAVEHSTVYVPLHMPDSLKHNDRIDDAVRRDVGKVLEDGLGMMKFLYDREKQFSQQLASARDHMRLPVTGYVRLQGAQHGCHEDGWGESNLAFEFTPTRKVKSVTLSGRVPDQIRPHDASSSVITLSWTLDGQTETLSVKPGKKVKWTRKIRLAAGSPQSLRLQCDGEFVPYDQGMGEDRRKLALLLNEITFEHR